MGDVVAKISLQENFGSTKQDLDPITVTFSMESKLRDRSVSKASISENAAAAYDDTHMDVRLKHLPFFESAELTSPRLYAT